MPHPFPPPASQPVWNRPLDKRRFYVVSYSTPTSPFPLLLPRTHLPSLPNQHVELSLLRREGSKGRNPVL